MQRSRWLLSQKFETFTASLGTMGTCLRLLNNRL